MLCVAINSVDAELSALALASQATCWSLISHSVSSFTAGFCYCADIMLYEASIGYEVHIFWYF